MKKTLLLLMLTALILSSCSQNNSSIQSTADTLADTAPIITAEHEDIKEVKPLTDQTQLYINIIDEYYNYISNGIDPEAETPEGMTGIRECMTAYDFPLECLGYAISDINYDGVPELMFADKYENWPDGYGTRLLAMYTLENKTPVLLFEGWARSRYHMTSDNNIYHEGSSGAAYTNAALYTLESNSTTLTLKENYFSDLKNNNPEEPVYIFNTTGSYDLSDEGNTQITKDEFNAVLDQYRNMTVNVNIYPFSYYENDINDKYAVKIEYDEYAYIIANDPYTFEADNGEYGVDITVYTEKNVTEFSVFVVENLTLNDDGSLTYRANNIYTLDEFNTNDALKLRVAMGEIFPLYGISYTTAEGENLSLGIYQSMKDGSVYLAPIQ